MKIAVLHPGAMGATVGAALAAAGHQPLWLEPGRSRETRDRAQAAGFTAVGGMDALAAQSDAVISVCPPHAAMAVARKIAEAGYTGPFLDANAVSPDTVRALAEMVGPGFIDGGIIGPPAHSAGSTRLYVSGDGAAQVAGWFRGSVLEVRTVPGPVGAATALKMCFAAYTKGASALLLAVRALAEAEGVSASLLEEWRISLPELAARSEGAARGTAGKAWRFVAEMEEIAATFEANRLPGGFHRAAADVYRSMEPLRDQADADLARVLSVLLKP